MSSSAAAPRRFASPRLAGHLVVLLAGASVALVATACSRASFGVETGDAAAARAPSPSQPGEGTVRRVSDRKDVPLTGFRVDAKAGDWLLESGGQVAVVDAHGGRVVDLGSAGHDDALVAIEPTVYLGLDDLRADVVSVEPAPDAPLVVRIERRVHDVPLRLWTFVSFASGALRIESVAISEGDPAAPVTLGEKVGWGNVPTWVQGTGFVERGGTFGGDFMAREGLGQAYALGVQGARVIGRFNAPQAGFHERAHTGEDAVTVVAGGASPRRVVWLAHAEGAIGDAAIALLRAEGLAMPTVTLPAVAAERAEAEVASCPDPASLSPRPGATTRPSGAPFARFALAAQPRQASLPAGCFVMRVTAPGYAPTPWMPLGGAGAPADQQPHAGRLRWHVAERGGGTVPARIVVHGIAPTPDPDWGDDPFGGAALEAIATLGDGEIPIPPGRYRATVSRGFEYTAQEQTLAVADGATATIDATIERVVDTRGWISADLHVHAVPSPDAPTLLDDRVRSLAASGVEVAAATDHNAVTDYGPTIRALGAQRWLASIVGDEVTTRGVELGHFNVFPLAEGDSPVPFANTTPHDIFAAARAAAPQDRDKVVQVNHPRMGSIGYFELLRFDPGDFDAWRRRSPLFDASFDALEVFNGDDYSDIGRVEACLRDWYALLDAGLRVTATGNSDSHKLTYHEPGVPRNYVRVGNDAPDAFDERAFIDAVRHGRVVVSSGPFVRLSAAGAEVGDDVAPGDDIPVHVHVEAPPWVDVATVEIVRRGEIVATWHPKPGASVVRLDETAHLALRPGDWIIAIARGDKPMTFLHRPGALPFAFTNPIRAR
ncbi:MAG TPA: CehA/McbA family metallohydrolase [Polyangiaceae bacterium]|nr:CehA/McbA family metallohydrolase [Polyangiaceae bacterium]